MIGHTSKAALSAARIALLAGASAAALFAASTANAQVTNPPFTNGDAFLQTAANASPMGADLTQVTIPGLGVSTAPQFLQTIATGAAVPTSTSGVLNPDGTPVKPTYQAEITAAPGVYQTGTGNLANYVLVDDGTNALKAAGTANASQAAGTSYAPAGTKWVLASSVDTNTPSLYRWQAATYSNNTNVVTNAAHQGYGTGGVSSYWYVLTSGGGANTSATYGPALTAFQAANPTGYQAYQAAVVAGDLGLANSILAANNVGFKVVSQTQTDPALAAGSYTYQGVPSSAAQGQGNGAVTVNQGASASTTSLAGGVVYANNQGQSTVIGPDGITGTGWTLTVQDPTHTQKTVISNGDISNTGTLTVGGHTTLNGGLAVLGGTTTDTLTVTGASTTNGITNTGDIKTTTLTTTGNATVGGQAYLNGGATVSNNLTVAPATNVSMGNNAVHDVGTPVFANDATNKAYVDKGLNKAYEGTAIALAISQPVFLPGQTFAMRAGWGGYEGQSAFGVSAAGVIAHNTFGYGSTVALDGGIGVGSNNGGVAGKAGVTVGFGGGSAPLK